MVTNFLEMYFATAEMLLRQHEVIAKNSVVYDNHHRAYYYLLTQQKEN